MKTKHTQGKWTIKETKLMSTPFEIETKDWTICRVFADDDYTTKIAEANAKLISAAPKILEALIELNLAVQHLPTVDTRTAKANVEALEAIKSATT